MVDYTVPFLIVAAVFLAIFLPNYQAYRRLLGLPAIGLYELLIMTEHGSAMSLYGGLALGRRFVEPIDLARLEEFDLPTRQIYNALSKNVYLMSAETPTPTQYHGYNLLLSLHPLEDERYRVQTGIRSIFPLRQEIMFHAEARGHWVRKSGRYNVWVINPRNREMRGYESPPDELQQLDQLASVIPVIHATAQNIERLKFADRKLQNYRKENERLQAENSELTGRLGIAQRAAARPPLTPIEYTPSFTQVVSDTMKTAFVLGVLIFIASYLIFQEGAGQFDRTQLAGLLATAVFIGYNYYKRVRP